MLKFIMFFKEYGIRKLSQITTGNIKTIENFNLPKDSIFHYLPEEDNEVGIFGDHWAIVNNERLIMAKHVTSLLGDKLEGKFRKNKGNADTFIKSYHKKYRKIKLIKSLTRAISNPKTLLVVNYGLLLQLYVYTKTPLSNLHSVRNLIRTSLTECKALAISTDRNNFIEIELPDTIPPISTFKKAELKVTNELASTFSEISLVFLLEFWKWLGEKSEDSVFNEFEVLKDDGSIDRSTLDKVNVIFKKDNKIQILNLGLISQWRNVVEDDGDINPAVLQKRFLKLMFDLLETTEEDLVLPNVEEASDSLADFKKSIDNKTEDSLEESLDITATVKKSVIKAESISIETDPKVIYTNKVNKMLDDGELTVAQHKKALERLETMESLKNPYGTKETLIEFGKVKPELLDLKEPKKFKDTPTVIDKSMLESKVDVFDKNYIEKVLRKDVVGMITSLPNAGFTVTDYEVDVREDLLNKYEVHTVRVSPDKGSRSTLTFKIPYIEPDGTYLSNGVKYRMRKQRGDMPIRKVNSSTVALTSYYGKVFIVRDPRVVNDYGKWLSKEIKIMASKLGNNVITKTIKQNEVDLTLKLPRVYTILGVMYSEFKYKAFTFFLNYEKRKEFLGVTSVSGIEKQSVIVGKYKNFPMVVDYNDVFFYIEDGKHIPLGNIETVLDITNRPRIDMASIKIFNNLVPLGFLLAYYTGLEGLLKLLPGKVKRVSVSDEYVLDNSEFSITFEDVTLVVSRDDKLTSLVLSGLAKYNKHLVNYHSTLFNDNKVYLNIINKSNDKTLGHTQLNTCDLMREMFIDPITLDLLKEMGEPTVWIKLLVRSAELLLTDQTLKETDLREMRIKGYERVPGAIYNELVKSARVFKRTGNRLELNPYAVWKSIDTDSSVSIVEEANPIKNINEKEAVTYLGTGGRSRESMVARTRLYEASDMGVISEATVDSGDVAINTYTSANPKFKTLRGVTERYDKSIDGPTSLMSTAALLSPGSDRDSAVRTNFATIQHAQGIASLGYEPTPLRTGYETIIGDRTSDLFSTVSEKKGVVTKLTKKVIVVTYNDDSKVSVELGSRYGVAAGATYKHVIVTDLKKGDKVDVGVTIAYNKDFFKKDFLHPDKAFWAGSAMAKTAIVENEFTFEDSSLISDRLADKLKVNVVETKYINVDFKQKVNILVDIGDKVVSDSILCTIEDDVNQETDSFSESSLNTLKLLSANSPRAKVKGVVEKIEVIYYGDKEDMSKSVRSIVEKSDSELLSLRKSLGKSSVTGRVSDSIRIDGKVLELDSLVIKFYITSEGYADGGDKGVFGIQLKTVFKGKLHGVTKTKSGEPIDAFFSYNSIVNRKVNSAELIGTTCTTLKVLSKHIADVYFNK